MAIDDLAGVVPCCAQFREFIAESRLVAVSTAGSNQLIQIEVESYCSACRVVLRPEPRVQSFVSERQATFDAQHLNRAAVVGSQGDWADLKMHHWHALAPYGTPPPRIDRKVISWSAEEREQWMRRVLHLVNAQTSVINDVLGEQVVINHRIVEKTLTNEKRTPFIAFAARCLRGAIEVWEHSNNDKNELRRYYLFPFNSDDSDNLGLVAVSAKDDLTQEQVLFNVIPMTASYANNQRQGKLLYIAYVDSMQCIHGCCDATVNGIAKARQLGGEIATLRQHVASLRKAEQGLKADVVALRERRAKEKTIIEEMRAELDGLLADG